MKLFLSLVGFQPSAVAVALASWTRSRGAPDRVCLFPSRDTEPVAERLARWARDRLGQQVELRPVTTSLEHRGGMVPAAEAVGRFVEEQGAGAEAIYYADPGPKTVVVSVVRALPSRVILVHSDDRQLHVHDVDGNAERWSATHLDDLGLDALLSLYGLRAGASPPSARALPEVIMRALDGMDEAGRMRRPLVIEGVDAPPFELAHESRGRLYGLFVVEGESSPDRLARVRDLERLPVVLQGLRPRVAVWSSRQVTLRHARDAGFLGLKPGSWKTKSELDEWLRGGGPAPGHVVSDEEGDRDNAPLAARGAGGHTGTSLVVCLGADPSATLLSLATHTPEKAWILYDARTPVIVDRASRLRRVLRGLPVGDVRFVPTDLQGRGISQWAAQVMPDIVGVRVDVTPGSKAQACALARIAGLELWSSQGHLGTAAPLAQTKPGVTLVGPPLEIASAVTGGALEQPGEDVTRIPASRAEFLDLMLEFLVCFLQRTGTKLARLARLDDPPTRTCAHGRMTVRQWDAQVAKGASPTETSDARGRNGTGDRSAQAEVEVHHGGQHLCGGVRVEGGFWIEELVAYALARAGAEEVRVNIGWAWPREYVDYLIRNRFVPQGQRPQRREIDVAARFGHQVLAVECKTGDPLHLPSHRRKIEGTAAGSLGRLAVPVLVYPRPSQQLVQESLRTRGRAIVLGFAEIADPGRLKQLLVEVFRARSTIGDD